MQFEVLQRPQCRAPGALHGCAVHQLPQYALWQRPRKVVPPADGYPGRVGRDIHTHNTHCNAVPWLERRGGGTLGVDNVGEVFLLIQSRGGGGACQCASGGVSVFFPFVCAYGCAGFLTLTPV